MYFMLFRGICFCRLIVVMYLIVDFDDGMIN